ncbi:hypothetical protein [Halorientalis salina]|uniref:hypothetical protein n=1 Tax=Halorientalis salina TaxID=2932266 RepID=UPI0010ABEF5C|nr:hypothetical protein [Halorientalis salina]
MTTFRETLTGVGLLTIGATLAALVLLQGFMAHPPIALPVALLTIGAGIATLDVPEPTGTPDAIGTGRRTA